jgi:hypothetical protein
LLNRIPSFPMIRSPLASSRCRSRSGLMQCSGSGSSCHACSAVRPSSPSWGRCELYQSAHWANSPGEGLDRHRRHRVDGRAAARRAGQPATRTPNAHGRCLFFHRAPPMNPLARSGSTCSRRHAVALIGKRPRLGCLSLAHVSGSPGRAGIPAVHVRVRTSATSVSRAGRGPLRHHTSRCRASTGLVRLPARPAGGVARQPSRPWLGVCDHR